MGGGGRAGGVLATLVAVAVLLALVAVASRGDASFGSDGGVRRPSHTLIDTLLSLYIVVMAVGALLFVVLLLTHKESAFERRLRKRENRNRNFLALVLFVGFLALLLRLAEGDLGGSGDAPVQPTGGGSALTRNTGGLADAYDPEFAYLPVIVVAVLGTLAAVAFVVAERARRRGLAPPPATRLEEALGDVLDESLDDLRAERDPRRAVIAAYARMEHAFAVYGLPRRAAEAPDEYVQRALSGVDISPASVRRLTALFERAKFSEHDVDARMKADAIEALQTAREELWAANERELAAAEEALAEARERAYR